MSSDEGGFEGIGEAAFAYDGQFVSDLEFIAKNVVAENDAAAYNKPTEELTSETVLSASNNKDEDDESVSSSSSSDSDSKGDEEMGDASGHDGEEEHKATKKSKGSKADDEGIELLDDEAAPAGPPRTKHEVSELDAYETNADQDSELQRVVLPSEDIENLVSIGEVSSILLEDGVVVVKGDETSHTVDEGSILFVMEGGGVLGRVREVFGPITAPFYVCPIIQVKNDNEGEGDTGVGDGDNEGSNASKSSKDLKVGDVVSCLPSLEGTVFVSPAMLQELRAASRPTDASNLYDEEVEEGEAEYSDDEAERIARQAKKKERQEKGAQNSKGGASASAGVESRQRKQGGAAGSRRAQKPPPPANPPPPGAQGHGQGYAVPPYAPYGNNTASNNYMHAQHMQAQMQGNAGMMGYPMQQGMPMMGGGAMGYPQMPQGGQGGYSHMSPALFMQQQQAPWPGFRSQATGTGTGQVGKGRPQEKRPVYKRRPI